MAALKERLTLSLAAVSGPGSDRGWTETFGSDDNSVMVLDATGRNVAEAEGDKQSVADRILDVVA